MMGKVLCTVVALVGIAIPVHVHAQLPSGRHSLSMEAKVTATGGASNAKATLRVDEGGKPLGGGWVTATNKDYSQKRNKDSAIGLEVEVRNIGREPQNAKLQWYF